MIMKLVFTFFLVLSISGCATVPLGDPAADAKNKTFVASQDTSGIYIYRNESFGAAIHMDVLVDGKPLGQTAAKTYFRVEMAPGRHTVTSISENSDTLAIDTEAGKLYFVWQEVKMGLMYARTKLHLTQENDGEKGVLESRLAATTAPPASNHQ